MSYYKPIGNPQVLEKKISTNPKFEKVQSNLDTGCSATVMKKFHEYDVQTKQLPGENFKRLHPNLLARYIEFIQQENAMKNQFGQNNNNNNVENNQPPSNNNNNNLIALASPTSSRHQNLSVANSTLNQQQPQSQLPPQAPTTAAMRNNNSISRSGAKDVYEGDIWAGMTMMNMSEGPKKKILLLDVRDPEDYVKCHLQISSSFHYTRLHRSQNIWTADIIRVINKDDWVICLYDLQEEIVTKMNVANQFFEKGINNIVILAGGLREFAQRHLHLLVGECPVPIVDRPQLPPRSTLSTATRSVCGRSEAGGRGVAVVAATAAGGGGGLKASQLYGLYNNNGSGFEGTESTVSRVTSVATSHKPKALANSLARRSASANKGWR